MRVRRISCEAYGILADVSLPETGLVVVTGHNGAGKSLAFIETVATAVWGKTLRGRTPWQSEAQCRYSVDLGGVTVTRSRKGGGKVDLKWSHVGETSPEYETNSKSQADLECHVGGFELWRRTHVFSSADAAHFSLATDAERKRLIEQTLGLGEFDRALEKCKADLKSAEAALVTAERNVALLQVQVTERTKAVTRSEGEIAALKEAVPTEPLGDGNAHVGQRYLHQIKLVRAELADVERQLAAANKDAGAKDWAAQSAEKALAGWRGSKSCPTCGQTLPVADRSELEAAAKAARVAAEAAKAAVEETVADLSDAHCEVTTTLSALEAMSSAFVLNATNEARRAREHSAWSQRLTGLESVLEKDRAALKESQVALEAAQEAVRVHQTEVNELKAVAAVVGIRGVRARLLDGALVGIQQVANTWLQRLAPPELSIQLTSSRTNKNGEEVDVLDLVLSGVDGGDYYGGSSGQRRRVDLALLLGVAAIAGNGDGTLFLDECLDGLDVEGVDAAGEILAELAQTRCVVVLTHNKELVAALSAAVRFHVNGGRVSQLQRSYPQAG